MLGRKLRTARRVYAEEGIPGVGRALANRTLLPLLRWLDRPLMLLALRRFAWRQGRRPLVLVSTVDWRFPYLQRPHHLARGLSELGLPVVFVSPRSLHDTFLGIEQVTGDLLLAGDLDAVLETMPRADLMVLSTDWRLEPEWIEARLAEGRRVVYDYIDVIDASIQRREIPTAQLLLFDAAKADERVTVVASAAELFDEVAVGSRADVHLISNGVDCGHFRPGVGEDGAAARVHGLPEPGVPVVGYFGALASWLDWALITATAEALPEARVVLIGPDYDGTHIDALDDAPPNLLLLPPVDYLELPAIADRFDVCLVPFLTNRLCDAVSPLKLFEYLALGKPVVATDTRELRGIDGVRIATDHDGFIAAVREALSEAELPGTSERMRRSALAHDWRRKADQLLAVLEGDPS